MGELGKKESCCWSASSHSHQYVLLLKDEGLRFEVVCKFEVGYGSTGRVSIQSWEMSTDVGDRPPQLTTLLK